MSDYITIQLSKLSKKHPSEYKTIVSIEDADLANFNWHVRFCRHLKYAKRNIFNQGKYETILIHRVILARKLEREKLLPHEQVDHIDGNGLNNRRENLRLATNMQNNQNTRRRKDNTSGYKGVSFCKGRYVARITINTKTIQIGTFDTAIEAHEAYCEYATKHFGEFAKFE